MSDEGPPPVPQYTRYDTLIFADGDQLAWFKGVAFWPQVGSVVELGNPNRDAIVTEVRLLLPQAQTPGSDDPGAATILVLVDDPGEGTIPRRRFGEDLWHGLFDNEP